MIDFLDQGRTISGTYFAGELRWLHLEVARKRREKLILSVLFLHEYAPAHTPKVSMIENGFEIFPHPQYSPDMSSSYFYVLPKLKSQIRGTQYRNNGGVIEAVNEYLGDQKKASYFEWIRKLEQRWLSALP